ncbi:hypothetical protein SLUN_36105 [Streptomyces lunaelactis]|uniref:Bulb-type lectin domain-containing protein n=1 Tax=Streptomyces lunaelactis TaxID=1535768 RepID=A0A2R4TFG1_9ACTN|nr:hypothetical protein SLUN_36105 [Streptomyces lunaelactis]
MGEVSEDAEPSLVGRQQRADGTVLGDVLGQLGFVGVVDPCRVVGVPDRPRPVVVAPKVAVVQPAAPSPSPKASNSPEKKAKATPKPNWGTKTVYTTSVLQVGNTWSTNRIRMVMQSDGNLVVYNEKGKPIWAAMTFGANHRAIFQQDGNLVIHNADDRPIWASKSHGHENAQLVLRADGKVVILHNGGVIWST